MALPREAGAATNGGHLFWADASKIIELERL
jgi:hypothetical protein